MAYLLDTNAFSDLMRQQPSVAERLGSLGASEVTICSIVRGEILYGLRKMPAGRRRDELIGLATPLLDTIRCEPVPPDAAALYADVKLARERSGLALDENDLWIAATALAFGATLVTRDADFKGIPGLKLESWSS